MPNLPALYESQKKLGNQPIASFAAQATGLLRRWI